MSRRRSSPKARPAHARHDRHAPHRLPVRRRQHAARQRRSAGRSEPASGVDLRRRHARPLLGAVRGLAQGAGIRRLPGRPGTLPARGPAPPRVAAHVELAGRLPVRRSPLSRRAGGREARAAMGRARDPVRWRCRVPAAQGRTLRPLARIRGSRAHLRAQGAGARRCRAALPSRPLRADRRQAAHSRGREENLGQQGHHRVPQAGPLCLRAGCNGEISAR